MYSHELRTMHAYTCVHQDNLDKPLPVNSHKNTSMAATDKGGELSSKRTRKKMKFGRERIEL